MQFKHMFYDCELDFVFFRLSLEATGSINQTLIETQQKKRLCAFYDIHDAYSSG